MKCLKNNRGQGLIEYLIIVTLIAVGSIVIMRSLSETIYVRFTNVTNALQGRSKRVDVESIQDRDYQKKDLGNFMNGAASKK